MNPAVLVSRDGGSSWEIAHRAARGGGAYSEVDAVGERVAALGYQPGATFSDDGGITWREVPNSYTPSC